MVNEHKVLIGNAFDLIKTLDDKSLDCVMTSPPYWGLRDYETEPVIFDDPGNCEHEWGGEVNPAGHRSSDNRHIDAKTVVAIQNRDKWQKTMFCIKCGAWKGQLGLEPTSELFIKHLVDFFDDVKLKLKNEGTCWINLGDTYVGSGGAGGDYNKGGLREGQPKYKQGKSNLKLKCTCMIPERFAWAMIEHGWILRNKIIWHKPNHMPESVTDRFTKSYEHLFFFVKQGKYDFNLDVVREKYKQSSINRITQLNVMNQTGGEKQTKLRGNPTSGNASRCNKIVQSMSINYQKKCKDKHTFNDTKLLRETNKNIHHQDGHVGDNPFGKNPGDVWEINTKPYPGSHFAVFPLELIEKPILSGCPEDGWVLDPFGGSGTVSEFCSNNHRNSITFELNKDYKKLIEKRLNLKEDDNGVYIKKTFEDW